MKRRCWIGGSRSGLASCSRQGARGRYWPRHAPMSTKEILLVANKERRDALGTKRVLAGRQILHVHQKMAISGKHWCLLTERGYHFLFGRESAP